MAATTVARVRRPSRSVVRTWPAAHRDDAFTPRNGLVAEVAALRAEVARLAGAGIRGGGGGQMYNTIRATGHSATFQNTSHFYPSR